MLQELLAKKNQAIFNAAIVFFCKKLGLTIEEQGLITVQEVSRLDPGTSGTCLGLYEKDILTKVEIRILSYASMMGMIDVLAHELIHARQHVRGEFYTESVKHPVFFGLFEIDVKEKFHKGQRISTTPYYERLCEIEAHTLSHELITSFCATLHEHSKTESKSIEDENGDENEERETGHAEEGSVLGLS